MALPDLGLCAGSENPYQDILAQSPARPYDDREAFTLPSTFGEGPMDDTPPSPCSTRSNAMSIDLPSSPSRAETALAALQYLPMPMIVLGPLKTVVLVNEAMRRLLWEETGTSRCSHQPSSEHQGILGQTISQIGVDMMHNGSPVWVQWEDFLDEIGEKQEMEKPQLVSSGETTPTGNASPDQLSADNLNRTMVHDFAVEVVLSPVRCKVSRIKGTVDDYNAVYANMIISVWKHDDLKHYTLTFTSSTSSAHDGSKTSNTTSRVVSKPKIPSKSSHSSTSSVSERRFQQSPSVTSSGAPSPSAHVPMFPPPGPPSRSSLASSPSILQKATKLRDALLNAMNIPCHSMWKDESIGIPNKALMRLMSDSTGGEVSSQREFMGQFSVMTEDFSRPLEYEELPIVRLVRTEKKIGRVRIGIREPKTGKPRVFDVVGEPVLDDITQEFLGGVVILKDVTEYMDTIAFQKEQNVQQLANIANSIPNMAWTNKADGLVDWFSQRWYEYTGLSVEESLGDKWSTPFHPDDMPATAKAWEHSLQTGEEYHVEYRCRRRDGTWRWQLGRACPMRDESGQIVRWFGTCTDIHEAVEARELARHTREQLLQVLDTAKVTLWSVDRSSKVLMLDGNMDWLGPAKQYRPRDFAGLGMDELHSFLFAPQSGSNQKDTGAQDLFDLARQRAAINKILDGKSTEETLEHKVTGTERWFRTRYFPLFRSSRNTSNVDKSYIDGVVALTLNITELRDRERELVEQEKENANLLANALAAKEASRMKSQFLANMSHEIRTPIAGVIGMSELLLDTSLDHDQQECAENIQRSANGLLTVINDILDFSKVESGRLDIEEVQFNLSMVLKDVGKMLSFAAEKKGIAYESETDVEIIQDLRVLGDPGRLRQILQNLLSNSIKFTSRGHVTLKAKVKSKTAETVVVEFVVEDSGIGIEESVRKKLFRPFSQADSSTARRFGGTGLGLTISKNVCDYIHRVTVFTSADIVQKLVELMRGEIVLKSQLGLGTTASFWIPFRRAEFLSNTSPLVELDFLPDRLQSDASISMGSSDSHALSSLPPVAAPPLGISPQKRKLAKTSSGIFDGGLVQEQLSAAERQSTHVLVVEDNHINQQIAIKTIKKLGFCVSAVWNGQEALDYLLQPPSTQYPFPDIILMDCQMPVMDGYTATRTIRTHQSFSTIPRLNSIPIVAMTASAIQGDKEKCERCGMNDYLAKPVRQNHLEKMLVKWALEGRIRRQRLAQGSRSRRVNAFVLRSNNLALGSGEFNSTGNGEASPTRPGPTTLVTHVGDHGNDDLRLSSSDSLDTNVGESIKYESTSGLSRNIESEAASSARRADAEEQASSLRDAKLFNNNDDNNADGDQLKRHQFHHNHHHQPHYNHRSALLNRELHAQEHAQLPRLTRENMNELITQQRHNSTNRLDGQAEGDVPESSSAALPNTSLRGPPRPSLTPALRQDSEYTVSTVSTVMPARIAEW